MVEDGVITGGVLEMGPLWDFDLAFGNVNYGESDGIANNSTEGFWISGADGHPWIKKLLAYEVFNSAVTHRFETHFLARKQKVLDMMESYRVALRPAAIQNDEVWGTLGKDASNVGRGIATGFLEIVWPNPTTLDITNGTTGGAGYDDAVDGLKQWTRTRRLRVNVTANLAEAERREINAGMV